MCDTDRDTVGACRTVTDAVFPGGAAVAVSLCFDDGRESQLDGVRILDEYGIRATFYVLPPALATAPGRWRAVASRHEIGNHSWTHPCSGNFEFSRGNALEDASLPGITADVDTATRAIIDTVGVAPQTFAYPCGQSFVGRGTRRRSYVPVIAERFLAGRGYGGETGNSPARCDLAHLDAYAIDGLDAARSRALVEAGMARGDWVILAGHDIGVAGPQTVTARELDRFCRDAARDDRIWFAPVADVARWVRAARTQR